MSEAPTVFVVDDDKRITDAIALLMRSVGLNVERFDSALDYLEQFDQDKPGCLISDVRMPQMSGLDLQTRLNNFAIHPPILMMTGHGDVPMAVRAIQEGAIDFIEKPFNNQHLLDKVHKALEIDDKQRGRALKVSEIQKKYNYLTDKEQQVFELIIQGALNKKIAQEVCVSQSAVEARRAKVMEKMQADNLSELMRMAMAMGMIEV